jgi:hypothetical protein
LGRLDRIPSQLAKLSAQYGSDPNFLSKAQRDAIYLPLFGYSNSSAEAGPSEPSPAGGYDFPTLSFQLIQAATRFSEQVFNTGELMLRDAVRRAHELFKEFLEGKYGASVRWSRDRALDNLTTKTVYPILRHRGVAQVFKVSPPPSQDWPYVVDRQGSKLVHAISHELMQDEPEKQITEAKFIDLQTTALRGAEALATIIDFDVHDHDDPVDQNVLITKVYTWGTMLRGLQEGSVAKWQEPSTYARNGVRV